jgi:hypothetical protein
MADQAHDPNFYKNSIPKTTAQAVSQRLGISQDDFYNYLAQIGNEDAVYGTTSSGQQGQAWNTQRGVDFDSTELDKFVQQKKAQAQASPTAQAQAPTQSYLGTDPTIQSGKGTIGGTNTMANGQQPESVALQQIAQIDPTSEALRNQLAASYLDPLKTGGNLSMPGVPTKGAPSASDLQSYLNTYKQVDPTGLAGRQQLEKALTQQAALGSQLDPETAREVEQQTRLAQSARGNIYGTPQLVEEAMTRGQAGLALQNQRQQALQGFYSSGQDVGNVANTLYQQGNQNYLNNYQNYLNAWSTQQQNQRANQSAALGYLTSGATPYQMGSGYLNNAEQRAASAAQGGPVYNPASLGQTYTGTGSGSFPDYGLNMSQNASQWFNSMSAYNNQGVRSGGSAGGAALGALGGAASGALSGSAAGIPGMIVGGIGGALAGGLKGYSG